MNTDTENGHSTVGRSRAEDTTRRETGSDSCNDLDAVRAQFEQWRSRPGRRHIPDDLWAAAIRLLEHYPVSVVSEHLRLNSVRLQQQEHRLLGVASVSFRQSGVTFISLHDLGEFVLCPPDLG